MVTFEPIPLTGSRRSLPRAASCLSVAVACFAIALQARAVDLSIATFKVDVTPPVGSPLCDGLVPPVTGVNDPLSARGIILKPADQSAVVLVALDWVGVGNEGHDAWRRAIADACETTMDRVAIHALHQHDAPGCDFQAERIAAEAGLSGGLFNVDFAREAIKRAAEAARAARSSAEKATHVRYGAGEVEKVAANRRILGPDGKVQYGRMSSCTDPKIRAMPEGVIDPLVRVVSFWSEERPLAVLSYYAVHPQSYYRTGETSADFVGMARDIREAQVPDALHIHFNGAGGNVAAGKYNDGSPAMRAVLAARLAKGMKAAWDQSRTLSLAEAEFDWKTAAAALPVADWIDRQELTELMHNEAADKVKRLQAARALAFADRGESGHEVSIGRLRVGEIDVLHMPGELFIEYQLAAQELRPQAFVCMAAYGDYGPGYIGLSESYAQGGYETSRVSRVSPRVEVVLMRAMNELLE